MPAWWYVVFEGTKPGIYTSWTECSQYVLGVPGNVHRKYKTFEEASAALKAFNSRINSIPPTPPPTLPPYQGGVANGRSCWLLKWEKCAGVVGRCFGCSQVDEAAMLP